MKTFITQKENIEDRFDVDYYLPKYFEIIKKLNTHQVTTLDNLGKVFDGPFGSNLKSDEYSESGIPIFRVQNVKDGKVYFTPENTVYITPEKHKELIRSEVRSGDVVITKTGWLGNAAVITDNVGVANIRADLAGVRITSKEILPEYLAIYVNSHIGKTLIERYNSGSTRGRVVIKNMRQLPIAIPSIKTQQKIVDIMQSAYQKKQELEQEAERLLSSIDTQIEKALGITVSGEEREELQIKLSSSGGIYSGVSPFSTFITALEDISKKSKLDPFNYLRKYRTNKEILNRLKVDLLPLSELVDTPIKRGRTPQYEKDGVGVIKVGSIDKGLITKVNEYVSETDFEDNPAKVVKDNIVIASTGQGSIGKVAIVEDSGKYVADNHISIVSVDTERAESRYVYHFLGTIFGKLQIEEFITGSTGQTELYPDDIKEILIPLPKKDIQQKIVSEIDTALKARKTMIDDAENAVEQAKAQVEEIILGK